MADVKTKDLARELVKDIKQTDMKPVTVEAAEVLLKMFPVTMARLIENGKTVEINDFAEFGGRVKDAGRARNIHTGEWFDTPAKVVPYAKFRKFIKEILKAVAVKEGE